MSLEHKGKIDISSLEQLQNFACTWQKQLQLPAVLLLHGDLGAGKTEFVRQLANCYGVQERVQSPTFNLMHSYVCEQAILFHLDLYRLHDHEQGLDFDFFSLAQQKPFLVLVEWAQKVHINWFLFSKEVYSFFFTITSDAVDLSKEMFAYKRTLEWKTNKE